MFAKKDPNLLKKKTQRNNTNKKYYIFNPSFEIIPVENYRFSKQETCLRLLVNNECFPKNIKSKSKNSKVEKIINEMGFEWESLSEPGHMRQKPYAITITEAIEKYSWLVAEQFGNEQSVPIHRISGGELFDFNQPEFKKQISLVSKNPTLYGSDHYNVAINGTKQILRYSSCTQKLLIAKELNFYHEDLPFGLFEISKSYRFEKENELQLCNRIRSFHLPEIHVLTDSINSSLKIAFSTHLKILKEIKKFDPDCELLCNITNGFFKENMGFLQTISKSINKPLLLAVHDKEVSCEDGVEIDIEYKVFDILGSPIEIATFQVDDGTTNSAFNINYQLNKNLKKTVSTVHIVFNASIERFVYFLLDRAVKKEVETGFRQLPFWAVPIHARVIAYNKNSLKNAEKLAERLDLLNFRVDIDDREIRYNAKKKENDLKWIPYIITVYDNDKGQQNLSVENRIKGIEEKNMSSKDLIKQMKTEQDKNIFVPRYTPMFLSKRFKKNN